MKTTIALTMIAALTAFLAACGDDNDGAAQSPEPTWDRTLLQASLTPCITSPRTALPA
jgi:hypothetical protein